MRDRALGGFALLVALAVIVLVLRPLWLPRRTVVRERTVTGPVTVVQSPALTPLRDSGPVNNAPGRHLPAPGQPPRTPTGSRLPPTSGGSQNRPLPSGPHPRPKTTHKPSAGAQQPNPPPQPPKPQPSQPPPVVGVTAPAPATVCARPVATANCP